MLQIETIENLKGFGNEDGYYYSKNFVAGQFGFDANYYLVDDTVSGTHGAFNWFAYKGGDVNSGMYAADSAGKIFYRTGTTWSSVRTPANSIGNGLIGFGEIDILYAGTRYLGKYDGVTWSDTAKDFDHNVNTYRPSATFEDWVVIGNGRWISAYNIQDLSFESEALTLPPGFIVRAISANQNGLLIGANYLGKSAIFLWDVVTLRSTAGWIWFDNEIQSICQYNDKWIVTTTKKQMITNGYSLADLPAIPDHEEQEINFNCAPAGTLVLDNKLYTANTSTKFNRLKSGVYIQDLTTGLFQFVPVSNGSTASVTMGALYADTSNNIFVSYSSSLPSANSIARIVNSSPTEASFISPRLGVGGNNKIAEGLKIDLSPISKTTTLNSAGSFNISLKIYNFKRQLWAYGVTNNASSTANTLKVDGSLAGYNNAKVGDEVTMLSGANAGKVRHITAIANAGTNTETWTLDSALPNNTESAAYFNVQPFQLVKTKGITITDFSEIESVYFDIKNRIKGRKFLAKVVITDITGVAISVPSLTFIYDDLGLV